MEASSNTRAGLSAKRGKKDDVQYQPRGRPPKEKGGAAVEVSTHLALTHLWVMRNNTGNSVKELGCVAPKKHSESGKENMWLG